MPAVDPHRLLRDPQLLDALAVAPTVEPGLPPAVLDLVRRLVDTLPPDEREVVEMLFWQRCSVRECAAELGRSTSWVQERVRRACADIKVGLHGLSW